MNVKTKNWIFYGFQLQFFTILTVITIFIEIRWLFEMSVIIALSSVIFSIFFISFMLLNLVIACFSMYAFVFILHVLDSNPIRTAPVCPIAIDLAIINLFFYYIFLYKKRYLAYFSQNFPISIFQNVLQYISHFSETIMTITFFTIFLNLQFGIEGIFKSRIIKSDKIADLIHVILIINGVIAFLLIYIYINILITNLLSIVVSLILAIILIGLFNFVLRKKKLKYPIEAMIIWRCGRKNSEKGKNKLVI